MDLEELRVLLAVAETGSVLAASDRLKLPRTTVRRRLDALEAQVGATLLFRGPAGVMLTEAGTLVAARARTILEEAAALMATAREVGETAGGVLRVVMPVGLPPHALLPLFTALRTAHPRLSVQARFVEDPLASLFDDVDLAFHFGERLSAGPWITRVVLPMREWIVGSPAYLATQGTPQSVADLAKHTLLTWRRPGADPYTWPVIGGGAILVEPVLVTSDIHILRQLAIAGHGLVFLPDGRLPDPEGADVLEAVLPNLIGRDCPLRMVVPEAIAASPKVRGVLKEITDFLSHDGE